MHSAPSVSYPVGRSRFAGVLSAGLSALAAASTLAWSLQAQSAGWRHGVAGAILAAAALAAYIAWRRPPRGTLVHTDSAWTWGDETHVVSGRLECRLDLQNGMLLRWQGEDGGRSWLWVERAQDPLQWDALRRAVYSRARIEEAWERPQPPAATS